VGESSSEEEVVKNAVAEVVTRGAKTTIAARKPMADRTATTATNDLSFIVSPY
jgi:hypothetical protein